MLRLLREQLLRVSTHGGGSSAALETSCLWSIRGNPLLKSISHSSESIPTDPTSSSLTISYLTTSCGLPPESALRTSKWFTLKNPQNADLVLDFLRNHGFDQTHIVKAMRRPQLLELHPESNLKPKMDFLTRYGFSDSQLVNILSRYPRFLSSSLDNQIAPHIEFLESLIETKEDVIASINRSTYLLRPFYQKRLASNVSTLRDLGVSVSKLIIRHPRALCVAAPTRFREVVVAVHGMGFDPSTLEFVEAVQAMVRLGKSSWDGKVEVYNSLGWSKDEFLDAFRRKPACMMISEKKIRRGFEFFVKDLGWKPSSISKYPVFLCYNFEKRVIPRCSVLQVLLSKGLIKKDIIWYSALKASEERFLERFVTKYKEEAPELMQAYQGMA
ncbi:hypothetical protein QJS10_CPA16g01110 [Acorus calamus]|uniref:Uncharacterized protein n=1 Tax=Acorus calamus TaxID=4465 RepID=A0AAV9D1Y2_ACOCL|nr:hypothetical protein QJS10_CPA16g01110 [Acorus calamus]